MNSFLILYIKIYKAWNYNFERWWNKKITFISDTQNFLENLSNASVTMWLFFSFVFLFVCERLYLYTDNNNVKTNVDLELHN